MYRKRGVDLLTSTKRSFDIDYISHPATTTGIHHIIIHRCARPSPRNISILRNLFAIGTSPIIAFVIFVPSLSFLLSSVSVLVPIVIAQF